MTYIEDSYFLFPFLGILIDVEAIPLFSGDLIDTAYCQATSSLITKFFFAIKSSPLYPFLEIKPGIVFHFYFY